MRSPQRRHSNIWTTTPLSDSMIVLRSASFPPQKRQSWFDWSLTVAIFSARNSSMAPPPPKQVGRLGHQLGRPYFWTARWLRSNALYRSIWPASPAQLRERFFRAWASASVGASFIKRRTCFCGLAEQYPHARPGFPAGRNCRSTAPSWMPGPS